MNATHAEALADLKAKPPVASEKLAKKATEKSAGKAATQSPAASKAKVNISGQVFVVTQGKENIKLALVKISAIPENDIIQYLNASHGNGLEQQKILLPELEFAKKESDMASAERASADREFDKAAERRIAANYSNDIHAYDDAYYKAADNALALARISGSKSGSYKAIKNKFDYFDTPKYFFESLPTPIDISKTDADGKFTLSLPPGKYAIAATSSREVFKNTESYYWLVWVNTSLRNQSLILSNDNLFETKCDECVQP